MLCTCTCIRTYHQCKLSVLALGYCNQLLLLAREGGRGQGEREGGREAGLKGEGGERERGMKGEGGERERGGERDEGGGRREGEGERE